MVDMDWPRILKGIAGRASAAGPFDRATLSPELIGSAGRGGDQADRRRAERPGARCRPARGRRWSGPGRAGRDGRREVSGRSGEAAARKIADNSLRPF